MRRFHFRLETLLKYRKLMEEQSQARLTEAVNRLLQEQEIYAAMENQLAASVARFQECQQRSVGVEMLKNFTFFHDKLNRDISNQLKRISSAKQYRDECLTDVEKAVRDRKVVENLKKRYLAQYNAEILKEEQKVLDELGVQRSGRGR